jgi:DNA-binding response OmpR family regulator
MSAPALILICDDDPVVHHSLSLYLDAEGFRHASAYDGEEALHQAESATPPDLILLDLMMPKKNGLEVCQRLRQSSRIPVIMLTARGEEVDRILGLELGADDYIVKPFSPREVVSRVKAVLRRTQAPGEEALSTLRFGKLEIQPERYQVSLDGQPIPMTPREVELLHLLASHPGRVYPRETILSQVWGYDYFGDTRTVDTHIKRVRQKLNCDAPEWEIVTVYGVGYKFEALAG